jgi:hypothetical protein
MYTMSLRRLWIVGALALIAAIALAPGRSLAASPATDTFFVCPSISVQNPHGMWVIGYHGGYYVNIPTQGSTGSKVFLTIPVSVPSLAQVPAGWGLYKSYPSYPNFVGSAALLAEGIEHWLGSPQGWSEGDMAMVMDNGDGTYTVHDMSVGETVTIDSPIPLASAAVW